jgi:hypothetical protein
MYQGKRHEQKIKKAGNKEISVKKHKFTSSSTWGLVLRKRRKPIARAKKVDKIM